jgi:hypothetical protein
MSQNSSSGGNETEKHVRFDSGNNITRIFRRKDSPKSIHREFKKAEEPTEHFLKPILRNCSSLCNF